MRSALQKLSYVAPLLPHTDGMNFLAHLHLATLAQSSLLGNLMADFVRGDPEGLYITRDCGGHSYASPY